MSGLLFRVLLPSGQYTRQYSKEEIQRAFRARKIPKRATVIVGGSEVSITDFLSRVIAPIATQKQKNFAESLGISFEPDINREKLSELIDDTLARKAKEKDSADTKSVKPEEDAFERMKNEVRAGMLADGSIPLSQATPDDILSYFEYVRDLHMVILYSPNNTFEPLVEGQKTSHRRRPGEAVLRMCHPDWMTTTALKELLKLTICNFPD